MRSRGGTPFTIHAADTDGHSHITRGPGIQGHLVGGTAPCSHLQTGGGQPHHFIICHHDRCRSAAPVGRVAMSPLHRSRDAAVLFLGGASFGADREAGRAASIDGDGVGANLATAGKVAAVDDIHPDADGLAWWGRRCCGHLEAGLSSLADNTATGDAHHRHG